MGTDLIFENPSIVKNQPFQFKRSLWHRQTSLLSQYNIQYVFCQHVFSKAVKILEENPFARFLAMVQEQSANTGPAGDSAQAGLGAAPARMRLGRVVSAAPLTVRVAGIVQPTKALRINERLVKGARWKTKTTSPNSDYNGLTGPIEGPVSTPHGVGALVELTDGRVHSPDTVIDEAQVEQLEIDLEAGDEVLLLTQDDQVFYVMMKVVDAV